jgi:hypothetical protein
MGNLTAEKIKKKKSQKKKAFILNEGERTKEGCRYNTTHRKHIAVVYTTRMREGRPPHLSVRVACAPSILST